MNSVRVFCSCLGLNDDELSESFLQLSGFKWWALWRTLCEKYHSWPDWHMSDRFLWCERRVLHCRWCLTNSDRPSFQQLSLESFAFVKDNGKWAAVLFLHAESWATGHSRGLSIKHTCSGFSLNLSELPPIFHDLRAQGFEFTGECSLEGLFSTWCAGQWGAAVWASSEQVTVSVLISEPSRVAGTCCVTDYICHCSGK